jgi:endonuclease YncB( thermonuclease family)
LYALKRIALVLAGVALVAALWIGGRSVVGPPVAGSETGPVTVARPAETSAMKPPPGEAGRIAAGDSQVRRIAPDSIAGPDVTGPLQRVAPRVPLTAATKPLKRERFGPPVPQGTLLYHPVASAAGEIEADGHEVRLAGIKVTPANRTCKDAGARAWPCGVVARTAFRAWLRGRAVACDVPSHPGGITTHCTLDGEDMALWLVRNGWAESADGQYDDAEAKARREKKGMFGLSPLGAGEE